MESQGGDPVSLEQVVWTVTVASQNIPGATCLTQALVTQVLLSRRGHPASLCIGVARSEAGEFLAHAWVECQGSVVIGGITALTRFTPLPSLDGGSA
jgi:Transglutaminase-like superfamily